MRLFIKILVASIVLSGCSTLFKGQPERPISIAEDLAATEFAFKKASIDGYISEKSIVQKKIIRDEIIEARLVAYDIKFSEFESDLYSFGIGSGIGTDWASLTISGLTAVTGGAGTKATLGAVNTALIGAKGSIDKRLLLEKTTPAIIAEMVNQRMAVLVNIREGLSKGVDQYNLFQGLGDLERYRRAGTMSGGLNGIIKTAGEETKISESKISSIKSGSYLKDVSGDRLRKFWKPDGKTLNSANEKLIKEWMVINGLSVSAGNLSVFLRDAAFAELRVRAVKELKLGD